eukprot:gnl/TRDRNA2_/TRDRNA2_179209_c0_seq1.p2 gnl/TRDRNA2_/TRDRNA2_179209_c0~~gnl/TRDRNA2_/TRDRNA2_179209_c0_seq1.p2  ORF type:complete len:135 (-),score=38.01 gnl/TRDRNA2_/TRDRNA2_179209_c0_seq1:95-499(-)
MSSSFVSPDQKDALAKAASSTVAKTSVNVQYLNRQAFDWRRITNPLLGNPEQGDGQMLFVKPIKIFGSLIPPNEIKVYQAPPAMLTHCVVQKAVVDRRDAKELTKWWEDTKIPQQGKEQMFKMMAGIQPGDSYK